MKRIAFLCAAALALSLGAAPQQSFAQKKKTSGNPPSRGGTPIPTP